MINLTPEQQARLDAIDARGDASLDKMVERYRAVEEVAGPIALETMHVTLTGPPWTQESVVTLLTYALRRLARDQS